MDFDFRNTRPKTIEDAVNLIVDNISNSGRVIISGDPYKDFKGSFTPVELHHTMGQDIRNEWCLWNSGSFLRVDARETYQISHGDDISGLILTWVWAKVRGVDFDPKIYLKDIYKFWDNQGTTALKAGGE